MKDNIEKAMENDNIMFSLPEKIQNKVIELVSDELSKGNGEYYFEIVKEDRFEGAGLPYKITLTCIYKESHHEHIHPGLTFTADFEV